MARALEECMWGVSGEVVNPQFTALLKPVAFRKFWCSYTLTIIMGLQSILPVIR